MGRKRTGKGKYLHLFVASLIFLIPGCALLKEMRDQDNARDTLVRGQKLLAQGDYEGALRENQRVLSLFEDRPPGDEALFNQGLLYSHVDNPKRDYRKAMDLFRKLVKDYPKSLLVEQSKVWIGVLQMNEKLTQANDRLTQANDRLTQANEKLSQTSEKLSQTNEKLSQANEKLNELIQKSKRVDLEIEQKRRKK